MYRSPPLAGDLGIAGAPPPRALVGHQQRSGVVGHGRLGPGTGRSAMRRRTGRTGLASWRRFHACPFRRLSAAPARGGHAGIDPAPPDPLAAPRLAPGTRGLGVRAAAGNGAAAPGGLPVTRSGHAGHRFRHAHRSRSNNRAGGAMMADSHRLARLTRRAKGRFPRPPGRRLRIMAGLGIAALGCSALAACGSAGASTGPVTLNYYQYPDTSARDEHRDRQLQRAEPRRVQDLLPAAAAGGGRPAPAAGPAARGARRQRSTSWRSTSPGRPSSPRPAGSCRGPAATRRRW